jgi:hypothetical protein
MFSATFHRHRRIRPRLLSPFGLRVITNVGAFLTVLAAIHLFHGFWE